MLHCASHQKERNETGIIYKFCTKVPCFVLYPCFKFPLCIRHIKNHPWGFNPHLSIYSNNKLQLIINNKLQSNVTLKTKHVTSYISPYFLPFFFSKVLASFLKRAFSSLPAIKGDWPSGPSLSHSTCLMRFTLLCGLWAITHERLGFPYHKKREHFPFFSTRLNMNQRSTRTITSGVVW